MNSEFALPPSRGFLRDTFSFKGPCNQKLCYPSQVLATNSQAAKQKHNRHYLIVSFVAFTLSNTHFCGK